MRYPNKLSKGALAFGMLASSYIAPPAAALEEFQQQPIEDFGASPEAYCYTRDDATGEQEVGILTGFAHSENVHIEAKITVDGYPDEQVWTRVAPSTAQFLQIFDMGTPRIEETEINILARRDGEAAQIIGSYVVGPLDCYADEPPLPDVNANIFFECTRHPETGEVLTYTSADIGTTIINQSTQELEARVIFDDESNILPSPWYHIPSSSNSATTFFAETNTIPTPTMEVGLELRRPDEFYSEITKRVVMRPAVCGETGPESPEGEPYSVGGPEGGGRGIVNVERLAGPSRVQTAVEISRHLYPEGAPAAVLARENEFADALSGVPLADSLQAPILLTQTNSLHPDTLLELQRLDSQDIHILGGLAAISNEVEQALRDLGYNVTRYAGADRNETSSQIANAVVDLNGPIDNVFVVRGGGFEDAIIAGATATQEDSVVLLTNDSTLSQSVESFLSQHSDTIETVYTVDSNNNLSDQAETAAAEAAGADLVQFGGTGRADTSAEVAQFKLDSMNDGQETTESFLGQIVLTTASNWPDGLAAGTLAAQTGNVLLLSNEDSITPLQTSFIDSNNAISLTDFLIAGGTTAVSEQVELSFIQAIAN